MKRVDRFRFDIFKAEGVRQQRLHENPYRFWSTYAIAYVFGNRLSGTVDVLVPVAPMAGL
jgi:hypothetical protein